MLFCADAYEELKNKCEENIRLLYKGTSYFNADSIYEAQEFVKQWNKEHKLGLNSSYLVLLGEVDDERKTV